MHHSEAQGKPCASFHIANSNQNVILKALLKHKNAFLLGVFL